MPSASIGSAGRRGPWVWLGCTAWPRRWISAGVWESPSSTKRAEGPSLGAETLNSTRMCLLGDESK